MSTVQTPLSRLFFNSRYLAGEELSDDESDQESDDEDDDEDPDNFEDTLDDSDNHQQQGSPVDDLRSKLYDRARLLKNNGQPNLFPKYGNSKQKPSANQDQVAPVVLENKDEFRCQCVGCSKICKSRGGLTLHVKKMHSSQKKSTDTCGGIATWCADLLSNIWSNISSSFQSCFV